MTPTPQKPKKPVVRFSMYWMYAIIIICLVGLLYFDDNSMSKEVSYTEFENYVSGGGVTKIVVERGSSEAEAFLNDSLAAKVFPKAYEKGSGVKAIVVSKPDMMEVTKDLLKQMLDEDSELVTLIYGEDAMKEQAEELQNYVEEISDAEVEIYSGKQPVYSFIIGVE